MDMLNGQKLLRKNGEVVAADEALKGHIISKWFFGVFNFLQKTNKNKSTSFFGGIEDTIICFRDYLTFN